MFIQLTVLILNFSANPSRAGCCVAGIVAAGPREGEEKERRRRKEAKRRRGREESRPRRGTAKGNDQETQD